MNAPGQSRSRESEIGRSVLGMVGLFVSTLVGVGTLHQIWILPSTMSAVREMIELQIEGHRARGNHPNAMSQSEFKLFLDRFNSFEARMDRKLDNLEKKVGD